MKMPPPQGFAEPDASRAGPAPDFDTLLADFRSVLSMRIDAWVRERRAWAERDGGEASDIIDVLESLLASGGKRLRPAILWFSHLATGGRRRGAAWDLAVACEFLHTYLLVHDDIMDHADTRRGHPTAHRIFARRHREEAWHGDADHYGMSVAIMVGDLSWSWAAESANTATVGVDAPLAKDILRIFYGMSEEVLWGQHLEMRAAARRDASAVDLERILRLKSGRYTVERPIQLGAGLSGAPSEIRAALARYGVAVGEAFQLRDDLLGVFGDPGEVGKPVGGDLIEGKVTFLTHHALQHAGPADARRLRDSLGRADLSKSDVEAACAIIESTGARAGVEQMIRTRLGTARDAIESIAHELENPGLAFLQDLLDFMENRRQ
jgi:geranylgeranyl diphosphate synthase type I